MSDCTLRHSLGALVLGGLEPDEADALERHLATCGACNTDLAELEGVPALLALTHAAPPPVPHRVRDRLVARAARRRERRRWTVASVAGFVLLLAVAGALAAWVTDGDEPTIAVPLEPVEPHEVSGWAWFETRPDALELRVELEGLEPLPDPGVYEAWLYTAGGRIVSVGQFHQAAGGTAGLEVSADGTLADYAGIWVTAEPDRRDPAHEGPTVVRAPVPDTR